MSIASPSYLLAHLSRMAVHCATNGTAIKCAVGGGYVLQCGGKGGVKKVRIQRIYCSFPRSLVSAVVLAAGWCRHVSALRTESNPFRHGRCERREGGAKKVSE